MGPQMLAKLFVRSDMYTKTDLANITSLCKITGITLFTRLREYCTEQLIELIFTSATMCRYNYLPV